jgi:hypothetical protein
VARFSSIAVIGAVAIVLGLLLPRMQGAFEVGPTGVKGNLGFDIFLEVVRQGLAAGLPPEETLELAEEAATGATGPTGPPLSLVKTRRTGAVGATGATGPTSPTGVAGNEGGVGGDAPEVSPEVLYEMGPRLWQNALAEHVASQTVNETEKGPRLC